MNRAEILDAAKACVCGEREENYGKPEDNFRLIAELWTAYLGKKIFPEDVANMMTLIEIVRIKTGDGTLDSFIDSYVDLAGYAACGAEITGGEEVG